MTPARRERADNAWRWLESRLQGPAMPPLIAFIGLGDGAVLDALEARAPGTRVLALEPNPRHARTLPTSPELASWRQSGRLVYLVDPEYDGADQAWRIFPSGVTAPPIVVHPDIIPDERATRAARQLKNIIHGVEANADARRRFAPRYLVNSLRNLPAIAAGSDVGHLRDAYRGMPAIVAGAGPTLDAAVPYLREHPNRGLLIAADTALRPLLTGGVAPHLAAALDPGQLNARHFLSLPECRDTWLVGESALDRQATAVFERRTFWFRAANHHPWPWFNELDLDAGLLEVWGSVITAAFQVARLAGCDPIVFVGADLSFTGGQPYARGTTYEFNWADDVAAGQPLDTVWQRQTTANSDPAIDLRGEATRTSRIMMSIRDWLLAQSARSGRRIVNASGAGMLFGPGIEQAALADVLSKSVAIPPPATFARRTANAEPSTLARQVREIGTALSVETAHPLLSAWREFSGDGFAAASVVAALDEAARGLEAERENPVPAWAIDWEREGAGHQMPDLLHRLSEILGRIPSLLDTPPVTEEAGGDDVSAEAGAVADDRCARLLHAWDLLERICDSVLRGGTDLPAPEPARARIVRPFSLWPEPTRWAVMLFEAWLAETVESHGRPASTDADDKWCTRALLSAVNPGEPPSLPTACCACSLLVLEWLRAAGLAPTVVRQLAQSLRDRAIYLAAGDPRAGVDWAMAVEPSRGGNGELRVSFSATAFALMRTGHIAEAAGPPISRYSADLSTLLALCGIEAPAVSAAIEARTRARGRTAALLSAPSAVVLSHPRVLTRAEGISHLYIAYPHGDGVVCVKRNECDSVFVTTGGAMRPHRTWPRLFMRELPFGEDGAVAWSDGLAHWPEVATPYVMYRRHASDDVTIEDLPYRPHFGQWWNGRLYWSCFSRLEEDWRGLASWAPGESCVPEFPGVISWAVHPDGDDLVMHPCGYTPAKGLERVLRPNGMSVATRMPAPLGPFGAVAGRRTNGAWTALAHPDIDVVRLESHDGHGLSLACPLPLDVAWLGDSLLVGTVTGELLLFDDLLNTIDRGRMPRSS